MLLVVGSALDSEPVRLVENLDRAGCDCALVTPADLSVAGWRLHPGYPDETQAAVAGRILGTDDIDAVIIALSAVAAHDLPHIVEEDRDYVAQEMGAFLLAWMSELTCPILDRPTPTSLAGCGRSSFEWADLATSTGVAANPRWEGPTEAVTVVAGMAAGEVTPPFADTAETLAAAAGRSLVTLHFVASGQPSVVTADARPLVGDPAVAMALRAHLGFS
jgi:hypothetical protein